MSQYTSDVVRLNIIKNSNKKLPIFFFPGAKEENKNSTESIKDRVNNCEFSL